MARIVRSRLRDYLEEHEIKITHAQLAENLGIRRPTITDWMNADRPLGYIDTRTLLALADYFGVEPFELLAVEEIPDDELETSQN